MQLLQSSEQNCQTKEKSQIFYNKRRSFVKKLLELGEQYELDVFICIHDKKTKKVTQYSTDNFKFSEAQKAIQAGQKKKDIF